MNIRSLVVFLLFLALTLPSAAQDRQRQEVLDSITTLMNRMELKDAKKLIKDSLEMMSDNGSYEFMCLYYYAAILYTEGEYTDAMKAMAKAVENLDSHIEEVCSSGQYIMVRPYFLYAMLAVKTRSKNAKEILLHAEEVYRKAGFTSSEDYLNICNELSKQGQARKETALGNPIEYYLKGDYSATISATRDMLASFGDSFSDEQKAILTRLVGLSHIKLDDLNKAEQAYIEAWNYASALDDTTLVKRMILSDLGYLYIEVSDYKNAEIFLQHAKDLYESKPDLGISYAHLLVTLGNAKKALGETLQSKMCLNTAYDVICKLDTSEYNKHDIPLILSSMSTIYSDMGYMDDAFKAALKARDLAEEYKIIAEEPLIENNIGSLYVIKGNYREAQKYFERAYDSERSLGSDGNFESIDQTLRSTTSQCLAFTRFINGDPSFVELSLETSHEIYDDVISKFTFLSEEQRLSYWSSNLERLNLYNSLLVSIPSKANNTTVLQNALFSKGLLLRTSNWIKDKIRSSASEDDLRKLREREEISDMLATKGLTEDSVAYYENRLLTLDKELSRNNVTYGELRGSMLVDWKDIAACLAKDEVAIEFVELQEIADSLRRWNSKYAAVVVTKGCKYPDIIPLCWEEELEALLTNSNNISEGKFINNLYAPKLKGKGKDLYELVWQPLEKYAQEARAIFYSPIGKLSSVAFGAITHEGETLGGKYDMRLVSTIANVIEIKKRRQGMPQSAIVYGGIVYDAGQEELLAQAREYTPTRGAPASLADDGQTRSGWAYIPGSAEEARGVAERLDSANIPTVVISGINANEESFKALDGHSPQHMHIATHGFFLADPREVETSIFLRNIENGHAGMEAQIMNRSGLLFAGGNRAWTGTDVIDGIDDGILTAEEISRLNLSNTDVVVLSACETGLGSSLSSEGIFGLQRAFKLAGVNTLIMSLWKVPDKETSALMLAFYDNWLSGMDKHAAFRKAQDYIRSKKSDPYYWAAFVMLD